MGGMQNETKFVQNVSSSIGEKGKFSQVTDTLVWLFSIFIFDYYVSASLCSLSASHPSLRLVHGVTLPPIMSAQCCRMSSAPSILLRISLCILYRHEAIYSVSFPLSSDSFVCAVVLPLSYSHAPPPAVNYLIIQLINAICNECEWIAIRIWPFSGWQRVRARSEEKAHEPWQWLGWPVIRFFLRQAMQDTIKRIKHFMNNQMGFGRESDNKNEIVKLYTWGNHKQRGFINHFTGSIVFFPFPASSFPSAIDPALRVYHGIQDRFDWFVDRIWCKTANDSHI